MKKYSAGYLYLLFSICFIGSVFGGISSTLMASYLPDVVKDIIGETDKQKMEEVSAVINAVFLFGMTAGGLLLGYLCDVFGRKKAVQLSLACIGLFTMCTAFAGNWLLIVLLRFFTGFGVGGVLVTTTILIAEEWADLKRNIALGILSITIPVGIFSAGLITYNFTNWRSGFLVGIVPLLMAVLSQYVIKESEQWKENKSSRKDKAPIFSKDNTYNLWYGSIIYGTMLIGLWAIFLWLPTWVQTIVHHSDGQKERGISMMLFAIGGLSGGFISGWVGNLLGMKKAMLICFGACFLCSVLLFNFNPSLTILSYVEMALIALFFGISQGVLNAYIPALFPVSIRSAATGFCFNIGRIFTASAVFFVGWLVNSLGGYGNALTIFSFVFLLGFLACVMVKEKQVLSS
ncbi:MAG TPA: MFS transporter [Ferruginibacter sp.]|nr:MFS transporter [Ferruginibacter sp.]